MLQIIGENLGAITWGAAIGWMLAFVIALHAITKGVIDVPVFVAVPAVLLGLATLACWIPAQRVSHIDPMETLRHE